MNAWDEGNLRQLHSPHASVGKPSPHGELGIAGGAPEPEPPVADELLELLDADELVEGVAPMSLQ